LTLLDRTRRRWIGRGGTRAGIALARDQTNPKAVGTTGIRGGEWGNELSYSYTVTKGLSLTPDIQVFWNPALLSDNGPAAVFTVRTTLFF
jgi:carbohydrate-selective porin OprB